MVDETIRSIKEAEQQAEEILVKAQKQKEQILKDASLQAKQIHEELIEEAKRTAGGLDEKAREEAKNQEDKEAEHHIGRVRHRRRQSVVIAGIGPASGSSGPVTVQQEAKAQDDGMMRTDL